MQTFLRDPLMAHLGFRSRAHKGEKRMCASGRQEESQSTETMIRTGIGARGLNDIPQILVDRARRCSRSAPGWRRTDGGAGRAWRGRMNFSFDACCTALITDPSGLHGVVGSTVRMQSDQVPKDTRGRPPLQDSRIC
jgi:hypothetical protein